MFKMGRALAWLVHDMSLPDLDVPNYWRVKYTTCHWHSRQVDHYWSEGDAPGVVPAVEVSYRHIAVTPWFGDSYSLFAVDCSAQVFADDGAVITLEDRRVFTDSDKAQAFYDRCKTVRSKLLPCTSIAPAKWHEEWADDTDD